MKDLLLIIDMQNVYLPGHPWACPSMPRASLQIRKLLDAPACGTGYDAAFTVYKASENPVGRWRTYNQKHQRINEDPSENLLMEELLPYTGRWPVFTKSTYSSTNIPELKHILGHYHHIYVTGVIAECCVIATALDLIDLGCHVYYVADAVSGQSEKNEAVILKMIRNFVPVHAKILTADELLTQTRPSASS